MPTSESRPATPATPGSEAASRRSLRQRLAALPVAERWTYALLLPAIVAFVAAAHGLLPWQIRNLPVAYAYSGFIECLSTHETFPDPICDLLGLPVGFVPLSDVPYLVAATGVRKLTATSPLAAKTITDTLFVLASWLSLLALQRRLGVRGPVGWITASSYVVLPFVLGHTGIFAYYIGTLLLPAYLLADYLFFSFFARWQSRPGWLRLAAVAAGYTAVRVFALFQDPYTAVMDFAVSGVLLLFAVGVLARRRALAPIVVVVAVWALSVAGAVELYRTYVPGGADYTVMPIDFFRAEGVDVASLFVPSHKLWWSEVTGVGIEEWNPFAYYSDGKNVAFNYLGYTLLVPVLAYLFLRRRRRGEIGTGGARWIWPALATAALVGLFVSLGPSIKIDDARPPTDRDRVGFEDYLMPPEAATFTLPTENLFVTLPGLKYMRAIYRWIVVPKLILLLAFAVVATRVYGRHRGLGLALALLALGEQFPDLANIAEYSQEKAVQFDQFNRDVLTKMRAFVQPGQRVFFVSGENDYLANYLAPMLGVATYNVGGDKNLLISIERWPQDLVELRRRADSPEDLAPLIASALTSGEVDAVVLPYFSLRWDAYFWPPDFEKREGRRRDLLKALTLPAPPLDFAESQWFGVVNLAGFPPELRAQAIFFADPNPIQVCDWPKVTSTWLSWNAPHASEVEIRIGAPDGPLFAHTAPVDSAPTDRWIHDGTTLYLQDVSGGLPLTREHTLAMITLRLTTEGCPGEPPKEVLHPLSADS